MTTPRLSLLALATLALACAHAQGGGVTAGATAAADAAADTAATPQRVLVTGSRIPQRVDPRTGRPLTASPVVIFTREELFRTGVADPGAALSLLEPSIR